MIKIIDYSGDKREEWNNFNHKSKNYLFMFDRDYMDYHSDRFIDASLMFYRDNELIALLPMNRRDNHMYSHGGLTYGGFITNEKMKQHTMNECFEELINYANANGIEDILYKVIPHIYHSQPSEEDLYSLFLQNASVVKIEASTVVNLTNPLKMPKGRKAQIARAKREGVEVIERTDDVAFIDFIELENSVLSEHHGTKAVHTGDEMCLLHSRFRENIHLYAAYKAGKMIAGTIIYEYDEVIHTQYMAANEEARVIGALDYVISVVIDKYKGSKQWLDFGISTEEQGRLLNEGLISQKEGFGGRTNIYYTYNIRM
ncbi:MAG: GNAT family N-acetyltransferase [Pseudobutyrivibrio sp.]|nr:GNAT family N-acetyltransferase [Pseudobutyrivibrio sp.]